MISIIMPTLWKGEHYKKMLPQLDSHPLVGEIIVVDNDTTSTDQQIFNLKKLKYLPQKENVYVNPDFDSRIGVAIQPVSNSVLHFFFEFDDFVAPLLYVFFVDAHYFL